MAVEVSTLRQEVPLPYLAIAYAHLHPGSLEFVQCNLISPLIVFPSAIWAVYYCHGIDRKR